MGFVTEAKQLDSAQLGSDYARAIDLRLALGHISETYINCCFCVKGLHRSPAEV